MPKGNSSRRGKSSHSRSGHSPERTPTNRVDGGNIIHYHGTVYQNTSSSAQSAPSPSGQGRGHRHHPYGRGRPARRQDDRNSPRERRPSSRDRAESGDNRDPSRGRTPSSSGPMGPPARPKQKNVCCNCKKDHHVRFCPYPNTEDGRLQACTICNTTEHAWFQCKAYKQSQEREYVTCWLNRSGLCILVHNKSIGQVYQEELDNEKDEGRLALAQSRPGPLTPAFSRSMCKLYHPTKYTNYNNNQEEGMEIGRDNNIVIINTQRDNGKKYPWELSADVLQDNKQRWRQAVLDPVTRDKIGLSSIQGTVCGRGESVKLMSSDFDTPNLSDSQPNLMRAMVGGNSGLSWSMHAPNPGGPSAPPVGKAKKVTRNRSRRIIVNKFNCVNCGRKDHPYEICPTPCRKCGDSTGGFEHIDCAQGERCRPACWCKPDAGHKQSRCPVECRSCLMRDPEAFRRDPHNPFACKAWCPIHFGQSRAPVDSAGLQVHVHNDCTMFTDDVGKCPYCHEQDAHWPQDCSVMLSKICMRQDCRAVYCEIHCAQCGFDIKLPTPQANGPLSSAVKDVASGTMHDEFHKKWDRVEATEYKAGQPWSVLRCKAHPETSVWADTLDTMRQATVAKWWEVTSTDHTGPELQAIFDLPECKSCWVERHGNDQGYESRTRPGT